MGGAKKNPGANLQQPNWDRVQLRPFKKEFYVPHPTIERRYILLYKIFTLLKYEINNYFLIL